MDTNIFLDFYHFSGDDLDELKKLLDVIFKEEITLYLPSQVVDEFRRNREVKIKDAFSQLSTEKLEQPFPEFCKRYPEYEVMRRAAKDFKDAKSKMMEKILLDVKAQTLKADEVIRDLFSAAKKFETEKYVPIADKRMKLGNPPGKNGSYGDALNWECLLEVIPDNEDLFFISGDKDYKSLFESTIHPFLKDEWSKKKKSKVHFYEKLSDFFAEHQKNIKLEMEQRKNRLINNLLKSGSFRTTHHVISQLSKFRNFSDSEVNEIIRGSLENWEIRAVMTDEDVYDFLWKIVKDRKDVIEPDLLKEFIERYQEDDCLGLREEELRLLGFPV
ncbi:MAG: PIN domain-containing protein [Candidatus Peribacteraceae bacterium]